MMKNIILFLLFISLVGCDTFMPYDDSVGRTWITPVGEKYLHEELNYPKIHLITERLLFLYEITPMRGTGICKGRLDCVKYELMIECDNGDIVWVLIPRNGLTEKRLDSLFSKLSVPCPEPVIIPTSPCTYFIH